MKNEAFLLVNEDDFINKSVEVSGWKFDISVISVADRNHFDPDPSSHYDADPDPVPSKRDANPRVLAYSPTTAPFRASMPLLWASTVLHADLHFEPPDLLNLDSYLDPDHAIDFDTNPDSTFITR